jgi:hypothetical protein
MKKEESSTNPYYEKPMIQKLFKPYIVKRKNSQCQVLIPLIELDDLCYQILRKIKVDK